MALFTDAGIVTLDDLLQFEASLVQVASTHGINVETKINIATSTIGDKLSLWLLKVGASDPQWMSRRAIGLSTVVVTPLLRRWLCFDSLARVFGEAYNVQLNTRFQGKWNEYQQQANEASQMLFLSGLGVVQSPLSKPLLPIVSRQFGIAAAGAILIYTAWVDGRGNESAPSPINALILDGTSTVKAAMAEAPAAAPAAAVGWNLYAGSVDTQLTRQNSAPMAIGSTWQLPASGLINGAPPIGGQGPDRYIVLSKQLQRG